MPAFVLADYGAAAFALRMRSERRLVEPRGVEPLTFSLRMVTKYPDYQQDTTIWPELFGNCLETSHRLAYSKAQACKVLRRITYGTRNQKIQ